MYACGPRDNVTSTMLSPTTVYTELQAGFDLSTAPEFKRGSCTSTKPFFFSAPVPEGSYRVTVVLGGSQASTTSVWAEARRLMLEKVPTKPNESVTRSFDVNVRVPEFKNPDGTPNKVRLKPREIGNLDWDPKLTLEFNGDNPSIRSITIEPINSPDQAKSSHTPTIYLAGDSTVVDQDIEPWAAWGQMLPRFFTSGVVIANHAESGETIKSFVGEQRFAKIFSLIQPGDYLFMQFNHNDQKVDPKTGQPVVPIADYKRLFTEYISKARAIGATPVLVTAMNRNTFDSSGHITNSLGDYPEAVRQVAAEQKVALIDLNAMSKTLFEALTPANTAHAFMHYPANSYPNQPDPINDDTHFNTYGAYELARSVVHGIRQANLPITKFLDPTIPDFDPTRPDPLSSFHLPETPIQIKSDPTKIPQT
jgi:lysophospholipase L1-like esterase